MRFVTLTAVLALAAGLFAESNHADEKEAPMLRHVVLFQFKETSSEDEIQKVVDTFAALPEKINEIAEFEHGTDVSVEQKSKGFTHIFVVSFRSEDDRDAYLPHPAHQHFVSVLRPHLKDVLVVDYWAK